MNIKFYKNQKTGEVTLSLLGLENDAENVELKANSTDAVKEKHVPVLTVNGNKAHVQVGSILHPMTAEHHIAFICLVTDQKAEMKRLDPTGKPEADFVLAEGEKPVEVYEYCNLHGLWVVKA
jgi:superoxide reductase